MGFLVLCSPCHHLGDQWAPGSALPGPCGGGFQPWNCPVGAGGELLLELPLVLKGGRVGLCPGIPGYKAPGFQVVRGRM